MKYLVAQSFATSSSPRTPAPTLRAARIIAAEFSASRSWVFEKGQPARLTRLAFCVHRATNTGDLGSVVAEYENGHPVT